MSALIDGLAAGVRRNGLLLGLVFILCLGFGRLGQLPLFDEDEGEYAEVATEMAARGDYVTPTLNGERFFEKPILMFWLQAPLVRLFGPVEWAFRLPAAVATLAWMALLAGFIAKRAGAAAGYWGAALAATSLGVVVVGGAAVMDSVLSLTTAVVMFQIFGYWEDQRRQRLVLIYGAMAVGFLAKGPVAVVVPVLVSAVFFPLQGAGRIGWRALAWLPGWLIFLALAAPWYGLQTWRVGRPFIDYFLLRENLGRFASPLQGHSGGWLYYVPVLGVLLLPHTGVFLGTLPAAWRKRGDPLTRFLFAWFAVVFCVFTLANTKLPHYLLIGLTPLFVLMALHRQRVQSRLLVLVPALALPAAALALPAVAAHYAVADRNPYIREMLAEGPAVFTQGYWALVALLATGILVACLVGRVPAWRRVPVVGALGYLTVSQLLLPAVAALQQDPVRDAAHFARSLGAPVVADNRMPSFAVYLGHPTVNHPLQSGDLLFSRVDQLARVPPADVLFARGGLRVLRVRGP